MPPSAEPVLWQINAALIAQLATIKADSDSRFWFDIKTVLDSDPDTIDSSIIPYLCAYPAQGGLARVYEGGSRVAHTEQTFLIGATIFQDKATGMSFANLMWRLIADIHAAIYANPKLGLPNVRRVWFRQTPNFSLDLLPSKIDAVQISYSCAVEYTVQDDLI